MAATNPPAGWYNDPTNPAQQRWWDGEHWSEHRRSLSTPPPPAVTQQLPTGPQQFVDSSKVEGKSQPSAKGGFWGCIGCLGLILVAVIVFQVWNSTRDRADSSDNGPTAVVACESAVRQNLKAPSTASFSSKARDTGVRQWEVTGTVDSENGFGAKVRAEYACSVTITADTANATLLYLNG